MCSVVTLTLFISGRGITTIKEKKTSTYKKQKKKKNYEFSDVYLRSYYIIIIIIIIIVAWNVSTVHSRVGGRRPFTIMRGIILYYARLWSIPPPGKNLVVAICQRLPSPPPSFLPTYRFLANPAGIYTRWSATGVWVKPATTGWRVFQLKINDLKKP